MTVPVATYRLQFRNGFTFEHAAGLVPYLVKLGISHIYCSPVFTAASGSTHGYDVANANEIEPELGGREGFERLCAIAKAAGLGVIIDIVPNHMAASLDNAWWADVIEWGADSHYSGHFDIDWSRQLTLPVLDAPLEAVISAGRLGIVVDGQAGRLAIDWMGSRYPLAPHSYSPLLDGIAHPAAVALTAASQDAKAEDAEAFHARVRDIIATGGDIGLLESDLMRLARTPLLMTALLDRQAWILTDWRVAHETLSYRRFFEVAGLAGVRVENPAVFDDTHSLTVDLVSAGIVDGLRIDHVDGLADPAAYLERLRAAVGPDCPIVVEKILGHDERLPAEWPVAGTTGYELITALAAMMVDRAGCVSLMDAFEALEAEPNGFGPELLAAKIEILTHNFAVELSTLVDIGMRLANDVADLPKISDAAFRQAIVAVVAEFPVYRTYGTRDGLGPYDVLVLDGVFARVPLPVNQEDETALVLLRQLLIGQPGIARSDDAMAFLTRFQQLSGPVMAKAVEDTLFYRYTPVLGLNEVGGEPGNLPPDGVSAFHSFMEVRLATQPQGLSTTATHDTKRGEDARARLYTVSEAPDVWASAVERWRSWNAPFIRSLEQGTAPGSEVEWMLYQSLLGLWPVHLDLDRQDALADLTERFCEFAVKAVREAKRQTSWLSPDEHYEEAVKAYAAGILSPDNRRFIDDFNSTAAPFIRAGMINGLTQSIVKITAPGVPDIYQGSEGHDFSAVDPDNRRPVDFASLNAQIESAIHLGRDVDVLDPAVKQRIIQKCLMLRLELPGLFATGDYVPLTVIGERSQHVVAYMRVSDDKAVIVAVQRLPLTILNASESPSSKQFWGDTRLQTMHVPDHLTDWFSGDPVSGSELAIADLFAATPFAILVAK